MRGQTQAPCSDSRLALHLTGVKYRFFPVAIFCSALLMFSAHAAKESASTLKDNRNNATRHNAARTAQTTPAAGRPVLRDGEAENRLIEVYRLIGSAEYRQALGKAENLALTYPHFQLAQLVYGDLLAFHAGPKDRPGVMPDGIKATGNADSGLFDLRAESAQRLKALRERPPANTVPSQFVGLSERNRHAIAVDASRSRLYLFENTPAGLKLVADYYMSVGKAGIEKSTEGDLRTPLGVYYITSLVDRKQLKDFYGSGALPINYPNPLDVSRGKTGSGIWLHGTPSGQFSRAPLASDGCMVLSNPDLERIMHTVEARSTPVVIAQQLKWVEPKMLRAEGQAFEKSLEAWRLAKSGSYFDQLLAFYTADFRNYAGSREDWASALLAETQARQGRATQLKDVSYLRWSDTADTMVVTFGEVTEGKRTGPVKRQYWIRRGGDWKIFFEGVIG